MVIMETAEMSVLLLLDLPEKALAGIDLLSFTTTPQFKGVRSLPPGLHFAFIGSSATYSERHGIWFRIKERTSPDTPSMFIAKWNASTETVETLADRTELLRWRANLGSIWRDSLTPYRQFTIADADKDGTQGEIIDWPKFTANVNDALLSRITRGDSNHWTLSSASSAKCDIEYIPGVSNEDIGLQADTELQFLPVNLKQTWREGATGRERTEAAQDRSWALNNIIGHYCTNGDAMEIIGELQFCFLMILTINNFSCLEQWKRILTLLFTCRAATATRSDLFITAIKSLTLQLQHLKLADSGLIDLADEGGSFLKQLLARFRKGLQGLSGIGIQAVTDHLDDLEDYLHTEHGWLFGDLFAKTGMLELEDGEQVPMDTTAFDEDDETGEYAPQVVELTLEQARLLNAGGAEETHLRLGRESADEALSGNESENEADGHPVTNETDDDQAGDLEDMDARF